MVKANVDKILEELNNKKTASVSQLASSLKIKKDAVMKSAEYLEQDGVIKIDHKWPKTILTLVKDSPKKADLPPPPPINAQAGLQMSSPPPLQSPNQQPEPIENTQQVPVQNPAPKNLSQPPKAQDMPQPPPLQDRAQQSASQQQGPQPPQLPPTPAMQKNIQPEHVNTVQPAVPQMPQQNPTQQQPLQPPQSQPKTVVSESNQAQPAQRPELPKPPKPQSLVQGKVGLPQPPKAQSMQPLPDKQDQKQPAEGNIFQKNQAFNYAEKPLHEILKKKDQTELFNTPEQDFSQFSEQPAEPVDEDPLNPNAPKFNLATPDPGNNESPSSFFLNKSMQEMHNRKPSPAKVNIPAGMSKDIDKIEFLIRKLISKLDSRDYSQLNDLYRKLWNLYSSSEQISENERYLLSDKINEVFDRIKHTYTIETVV